MNFSLVDTSHVGLDALDTVLGEGPTGIANEPDGLEDVGGYHGFEDVELEVAVTGSNGYSGLVAHHLGCDHSHCFTLRRVHLT